MSVEIVISHYNEKIGWIYNIKYPFTVYSNHFLFPNTYTNKGNEANGYLKYIIDNYNNLPDYVIFIHGDRKAYHHDGNLDNIINKLTFDKLFCTLNNRLTLDPVPPIYQLVMLENIDVFEAFLKRRLNIKNIRYYGNAQFYVHKSLILKHKLSDYKYLYNWKQKTTLDTWYVGLIFEYMWYTIFCL